MMKHFDFPKFKKYAGQPVRYIQSKLDGHLMKIYRDDQRTFTILTKNDKDITDKLLKIKHIREELIGLPENSVIFAELHCPGRFATDVSTMLNAADENLRLTAFAAPLWHGDELVNDSLEHVNKILQSSSIDAADITICIRLENKANLLKTIDLQTQKCLLKEALDKKLEGWVLKESHMDSWYKLKPTKTVDCFVIGTCESFSAQHLGGLKSIVVAIWSRKYPGPRSKKYLDKAMVNLGNVGSGFTAEYRATLNTKEKRDALIGKICEVEYDSLASNGKLRFPRFVRWRDDKDKSQCGTSQFD